MRREKREGRIGLHIEIDPAVAEKLRVHCFHANITKAAFVEAAITEKLDRPDEAQETEE
jgi:hypothetical protein